jgi:glycosyltransferase involved in cell wall biosynthesis
MDKKKKKIIMSKIIYDVLIIGELAGTDLLYAEHISRKGLKCCILRRHHITKTTKETISHLSSYHTHFREEDIIYYKNELDFLRIAKTCRLIFSITGTLVGALRMLWPLRHFLGLPPVVNLTTGSDITELAVEKSFYGILYRQYLRFVDLNWCAPHPYALKNINSLKVPNVVFMRIPWILLDEVASDKNGNNNNENKPLRFFHASHLDWKVNDPGAHRNSSKGNDRFIKAFARAIKDGLDAYCVILDRGPDRNVAKELIRNLEVEDRFIWKPHLPRDELVDEFRNADVAVDQFDVGGFGGVAIEPMSLGKPVITYINENCSKLLYVEPPPVLNCHTEDEIYEQIMKCRDRIYLQNMGKQAKEWIYKYHHWENCLDQFLFYYTLLTGHRVLDYGWDWNPYANRERS